MSTRIVARRMAVGAVLGLLLGVVCGVLHGEPITQGEAAAYIASRPAEAAADIVKLDTIEEAVPVVSVPPHVVWILGRDVVVTWQGPLVVDVANGALKYSIELESLRTPGVVPAPRLWEGIGIGAAAGVLTTAIVALALAVSGALSGLSP